MTFKRLKSRRDFIRLGCQTMSTLGAAAAFGHAGLLTAQAATTYSDYKALVCIFLFGGSDANNMLIPNDSTSDPQYGYKTYQTARQGLALAQNTLASIQDSKTGHAFGLHPSLAPIASLYGTNRATLVANVGTLVKPVPRTGPGGTPNFSGIPVPLNLYSHSDQQTEWQNAAPQGGVSTGWAGRLADRVYSAGCSASSQPMSFGEQLPTLGISGNSLELLGNCTQQSSVVPGNFGLIGLDAQGITDLTNMLSLSSGVTLVQAAQSSLKTAMDVAKIVNQASNTPVTGFPTTDIGNQLAQVATLIKLNRDAGLGATRQIFFCSQGGYDTHSGQLTAQSQLFADLANAMAAFDTYVTGTLAMADKVVTFTESEFSRTFQPNGNAGTDHAWGEHTMVMGPISGGRIYGTYPTLVLKGPDDSGDRGNWVPTTAIDQYGVTFARWFGMTDPADLSYVFPNIGPFGNTSMGFLPG